MALFELTLKLRSSTKLTGPRNEATFIVTLSGMMLTVGCSVNHQQASQQQQTPHPQSSAAAVEAAIASLTASLSVAQQQTQHQAQLPHSQQVQQQQQHPTMGHQQGQQSQQQQQQQKPNESTKSEMFSLCPLDIAALIEAESPRMPPPLSLPPPPAYPTSKEAVSISTVLTSVSVASPCVTQNQVIPFNHPLLPTPQTTMTTSSTAFQPYRPVDKSTASGGSGGNGVNSRKTFQSVMEFNMGHYRRSESGLFVCKYCPHRTTQSHLFADHLCRDHGMDKPFHYDFPAPVVKTEPTDVEVEDAATVFAMRLAAAAGVSIDEPVLATMVMAEAMAGAQFDAELPSELRFSVERDCVGGGPQDGLYYCNFCDYRSSTLQPARWHFYRRHATQKPPAFRCSLCQWSYITKHELKHHMEEKHQVGQVFRCKLCPLEFVSHRKRNQHAKLVHGIKAKRGRPTLDDSQDDWMLQSDLNNQDPSQQQQLLTEQRVNVRDHYDTDETSGGLIMRCKYCDFRSTTSFKMYDHFYRYHSKERPLKCRYCEQCFVHPYERAGHERAIHTQERPVQCLYCTRAFATLAARRMHVYRTHPEKMIGEVEASSKRITVVDDLDGAGPSTSGTSHQSFSTDAVVID
ncbi:uncharacterized protein LOC111251263 [Varroa destructor]|uniref:C2H2-type domain-containing protein n=1 Tax=Varroa destructor TaxID=109461 RepID=A0A7M7K945_VARDE|nr:uncharacterized protein LOC111251263 [Varroa destructor]